MFATMMNVRFPASMTVSVVPLVLGCSPTPTSNHAQSPSSCDCPPEPLPVVAEPDVLSTEEVETATIEKELLEASLGDLLNPADGLKEYGEGGFEYGLSTEADLDQDGFPEKVWVIAHAKVTGGRPTWDDGQEWQVYVQEEDGKTTHLFAGMVQLGKLDMSVTYGSPPTVLVQSNRSSESSMYEYVYKKPGVVEARTLASREIMRRPTHDGAKAAAEQTESAGNKQAATNQSSAKR